MPTGLGKKKSWKKRIPALDKTKIKLFLPFIRNIQLQERKQMSQELLEERQQEEKLQEEERKEVEEYKKRLAVPEQRIIQLRAEKHKLFLQLKKILDADEEKAKETTSKNEKLGNNNLSAGFIQPQAAVTGSLPGMMFPHPGLSGHPGVLPPPMMFAVGMPPMFPPHQQSFPMYIGGFPPSSTNSSTYNNSNNLNDATTMNDVTGRLSVIGPSMTLTGGGGGGSIISNNNIMPSEYLMMNSAMWTQQQQQQQLLLQQNRLIIPTPQTIDHTANMSLASVNSPQLMQNSQQQSFGSFGSLSSSTSSTGTFTKKKPFHGSVTGELIGNLNPIKSPQQYSQEFVETNGIGQLSPPKTSFRYHNQQVSSNIDNNLSSHSFRPKGVDPLSAPGIYESTQLQQQQQQQPRTLFNGNNINNTGNQHYQRYQQQQRQRQQQTFGSSRNIGNNFSSGANSQY